MHGRCTENARARYAVASSSVLITGLIAFMPRSARAVVVGNGWVGVGSSGALSLMWAAGHDLTRACLISRPHPPMTIPPRFFSRGIVAGQGPGAGKVSTAGQRQLSWDHVHCPFTSEGKYLLTGSSTP